jgi:hypothetical protein
MIQKSFYFSRSDSVENHVTDVMKRFVWSQDESHEVDKKNGAWTYLKQTMSSALKLKATYAPFRGFAALQQQ